MAAGIPQEKAEEYIAQFSAKLVNGESVDHFTYKRVSTELNATNTSASLVASGYLEVLFGNEQEALEIFRLSLDPQVNDFFLAQHFYEFLKLTFNFLELSKVAYILAEKYPSKMFSQIAYSNAYRFGERSHLSRFFDEHIKLLSDAEGRQKAMKHKDELLSELDGAFDASQSTHEQFDLLASIIWSVVKEFKAITGYVQLSDRGNGCYIVDIKGKSPKEIAKMNFALADKVCEEDKLDKCRLLARFSSPRQLHTGVSYVGN
ncbi:hypothetical protein GW590_08180 [Rahnella sp. SAP-1]|uniref:Uncharacterized protein n=1 Tax=Rouxiella aceris TaxID=2703884 RepID=A0A848MI76_9GAMM|nr:hypothetical protein [Rouxiella aceris]NMP26839.1 hypothetical protein [Rouxiella aceris]